MKKQYIKIWGFQQNQWCEGNAQHWKLTLREKKISHEWSMFLIQIKIKEEQWKYITSRKKGKIKSRIQQH